MKPQIRKRIQRDFSRIAIATSRRRNSQAARHARALVRWVRPQKSDRILDAACGAGELTKSLAQSGARVTAVDLTPQMLAAARDTIARAQAKPGLALGNLESLPYKNSTFTLTICTYAFANFPDPLRVMRELARVTKKRGRVVIADIIAPEDSEQSAVLNRIENLRGHMPTRILRHSEFLELFRAAGLRLLRNTPRRSFQRLEDWLRLSPAATRLENSRRLRRTMLDAARSGCKWLQATRSGIFALRYATGWFMLGRM